MRVAHASAGCMPHKAQTWGRVLFGPSIRHPGEQENPLLECPTSLKPTSGQRRRESVLCDFEMKDASEMNSTTKGPARGSARLISASS